MKILVFGDIHNDILAFLEVSAKAEYADLAICLGDITVFGQELEQMVALLNELPIPVLLMHGNHERESALKKVCASYSNISYVHKTVHTINEFNFIFYGGDGFSTYDDVFESFVHDVHTSLAHTNHTSILCVHGPPHNTLLDIPFDNYHSGSESYRTFIETHQPLLTFCGHIHEGEGYYDTIKKTIIHNPGPYGIIVDIEKLANERREGKTPSFEEGILHIPLYDE